MPLKASSLPTLAGWWGVGAPRELDEMDASRVTPMSRTQGLQKTPGSQKSPGLVVLGRGWRRTEVVRS